MDKLKEEFYKLKKKEYQIIWNYESALSDFTLCDSVIEAKTFDPIMTEEYWKKRRRSNLDKIEAWQEEYSQSMDKIKYDWKFIEDNFVSKEEFAKFLIELRNINKNLARKLDDITNTNT